MFATPGLAQSTSSSTVSPLCTKQGGPTVPSHLEYIFILFVKTVTSLYVKLTHRKFSCDATVNYILMTNSLQNISLVKTYS